MPHAPHFTLAATEASTPLRLPQQRLLWKTLEIGPTSAYHIVRRVAGLDRFVGSIGRYQENEELQDARRIFQ